MEDDNVYETEPSNREDLKHTDTVSTAPSPDGTDIGADRDDAPIGVRVAHDPSNLGNDIPEEGDLTHESPMNQPLGRAPAM